MAPKRSLDSWKGPPSGYPDRDPRVWLQLRSWFAEAPEAQRLRPWVLFERLRDFFGDHRVELHSVGEAHKLFRTSDPWESSRYSVRLRTTLARLGEERAWESLGAALTTWLSIGADRGGGAHRHQVWMFDFRPWVRDHSATMALFIAGRHIADSALGECRALVRTFFEVSHNAGATYGNGNFVVKEPGSLLTCVDPELITDTLQTPGDFWRTTVPWVYAFNLFGPDHLKRLGPIQQDFQILDSINDTPIMEEIGDALLVIERDIESCLIRAGAGDDGHLWIQTFTWKWLLARCAKAGMLALQNMDWLEDERRRIEEYQRQQALLRQRGREEQRKRRTARSTWQARLTPNPPRFLRGIAVPVGRDSIGGRAGHGEHLRTQFNIRIPNADRALTLYGAAGMGTPLLVSPIRAGSPDAERAAFEFNLLRDGWDGEHAGEVRPPRVRLRQWRCRACEGRHFHLAAAFEYPEDLDDLEPDQKKRPEDFFTWFWLLARCAACGLEDLAADIECA